MEKIRDEPAVRSIEILADMATVIEELDETNLSTEQEELIRRLEADGMKLLDTIESPSTPSSAPM